MLSVGVSTASSIWLQVMFVGKKKAAAGPRLTGRHARRSSWS
jgi:hypothetical protein